MHYMNTVLDEVHFIERIYTIKKTQRIHCTEIELKGEWDFKKNCKFIPAITSFRDKDKTRAQGN